MRRCATCDRELTNNGFLNPKDVECLFCHEQKGQTTCEACGEEWVPIRNKDGDIYGFTTLCDTCAEQLHQMEEEERAKEKTDE